MKIKIRKICFIFLFTISSILLNCTDCPNGIDENCEKNCTGERQSDMTNCTTIYGPLGNNDPIALEKCKNEADDKYQNCYWSCPCAN